MKDAVSYYPLCRAVARRRCPPTMDYQDAMQDAMVGLLEAPDRMSPWVVVHRRVIDSIRSHYPVGDGRAYPRINPIREDVEPERRAGDKNRYKRRGDVFFGGRESVAVPVARCTDSEADMVRRQAATLLVDAVAALPQREREVVYMRYTQDMPCREVAAVLGCSESNVSHITRKAFRHLRQWLLPLKFDDLCPS